MDYKKRQVTLDGRRETMYIFAAPLGLLSDVFAVDVRTQGSAIRTAISEVLDYEYDSSFYSGQAYLFSVYRDITLIQPLGADDLAKPLEIDTQRLYIMIGDFLSDNGEHVVRSDWETEKERG